MKKTIKRILAVILAVSMIAVCFTACDDKTGGDSKKYTIGICQLAQHPALDTATEGFKKAVIDKIGAENVVFDEQNAANDSPTCATICNQFVASNVDLIMANATPALQAAAAATTTIPIVATSVTDYATALDIKDWNGLTGINVTGTADLAPLDKQAQMIKEIVPDAKNVAILYCSAEPNSKYQAQEMTKHLTQLDITSKEYTAADSNDLASVVQGIVNDKVDAIYVPTDNTIASSAATVNEIAMSAGIPVITGEEEACKGCGIASYSIGYYNIGYIAGEMAAEILLEGKDPATMPIQTDKEPVNKYIKERTDALGITVPDTYEEIVIA